MKALDSSRCSNCGLVMLKSEKKCAHCGGKSGQRLKSGAAIADSSHDRNQSSPTTRGQPKAETTGSRTAGKYGWGVVAVMILLYFASRIPIIMRHNQEHQKSIERINSRPDSGAELRKDLERRAEMEGISVEELLTREIIKMRSQSAPSDSTPNEAPFEFSNGRRPDESSEESHTPTRRSD